MLSWIRRRKVNLNNTIQYPQSIRWWRIIEKYPSLISRRSAHDAWWLTRPRTWIVPSATIWLVVSVKFKVRNDFQLKARNTEKVPMIVWVCPLCNPIEAESGRVVREETWKNRERSNPAYYTPTALINWLVNSWPDQAVSNQSLWGRQIPFTAVLFWYLQFSYLNPLSESTFNVSTLITPYNMGFFV